MSRSDDLRDRLDELFSDDLEEKESRLSEIDQAAREGGLTDIELHGMLQIALDNASVGICLTDTEGRFLYVNQALVDMLGYERDELVGASFQAITHGDDQQVGTDAMRAMLSGEQETAEIENRYLCKDGGAIWVSINTTVARGIKGEALHFVTFIQNISDQKRTALLLKKRVNELHCLNDIGHKIDEKPQLSEFLQWVTEQIPAAMRFPDICVVAIEYGENVFGVKEALELGSKIVGGLRIGGELVGWLHIAYTEEQDFIDEESALIGAIVSRVSGYIETQAQYERAQRRSEELVVLNAMGSSLTGVLEIEVVVNTVYRHASRLVDVANFFIALYDRERNEVSFPLVYLDGEPYELPSEPLGDGLTAHVIQSARPLLFSKNVQQGMRDQGIETVIIGDEQIPASWLGVPIIYSDEVIGVITVQSFTAPGLYQEHERDLLATIANQAANAIAVTRQYVQTQAAMAERDRQARNLTILNEMGQELTAIMDSEIIVESVYRYCGRLMDVTNFFVALYDDAEGLSFPLIYNNNQRIEVAARPLGTGLTDHIVRSAVPLLLSEDVPGGMKKLGIEFVALGDDTPSLSWLGVPILHGGQVIGVIAVQSITTPSLYKEYERDLLVAVASQTANALAISRQYEQTQNALAETRALYEGGSQILRANNLQEILVALVNTTALRYLDQANIVFFDRPWDDEIPNTMTIMASWFKTGEDTSEVIGTSFEVGMFASAGMFNPDRPTIIPDITEDENVDETLRLIFVSGGLRSAVGFQLKPGGQWIGSVTGQSSEKFRLTENELRRINSLVEQAATVIQNQRLFEQSQQALTDMQSLYEGSARVVDATTLDEILQALVEATALRRLDSAGIAFFDQVWGEQPPRSAIIVSTWERGGGGAREPIGTLYDFDEYPYFHIFDRNDLTIIGDIISDKRLDEGTRNLVASRGIRAVVVLPLMSGGQWYGVVVGQSNATLALGDGEVRQINSLVDQAATVIQGLRLQEDMQERLHELTALQRLMSREAWSAYQAQVGEQLGYLYDRVNVQPVGIDLLSENVRPMIAGKQGEEYKVEATSGGDGKAALSMPLSLRGEAIGVIGVQCEARQMLSPEDEAFLAAISEQVAQAMERARLMEQTQKAAVELAAVAEVSTATSTILDPSELLQSVVDLTKENFGLYHAHVYLIDQNSKNLNLAAGSGQIGRSMTAEGWVIQFDDENSLVARTARERGGHIIGDVRREIDFLPNPLLPDTLSELAVPMVVGRNLLGVFDVQSDRVGRFTNEDVRTYSTLASQVAVALQNAQLYAEQLDTVERLRELDNMKSAFLANMSHELRTPLNSILGFTQVILEGLDGPLTDLMVSDLELIEKNGKHLLALINDVLDMAKIEAGRLSMSPEPVNLYDLIEEVMISSSSLAREKDLYMHLNAEPSEIWTVTADQVRMRQIFVNLLGNSIKFTDVGGITIEMERLWATGKDDGDKVQVRIRDTGIGIPAEKLEEVFEAFSQVDSSTTRKAGGTGLGLPISRRLVELLGGRLWAESTGVSGEGSAFCLELPVNQEERLR